MKLTRNWFASSLALCTALLGISCATKVFDSIDRSVYTGDSQAALQALEKDKKELYGTDAVLYYLDKGMIAHYAGQYEDSTKLLQSGEREIEAAFTKSITQYVSTFILNDTTREYAGEDYEDLYLNIFNALNYYHLGKSEDAMVEIRRLEEKLRRLSVKYNAIENELVKQNSDAAAQAKVKVQFSNSALARYLSVLFYRANGQYDDARIDRDWFKRAYTDQKIIYPYPVPSSIDEELNVPANKARLNIISFSGLSPVKVEDTIRIQLGYNWIKIALPRMVRRQAETSHIQLEMQNGQKIKLELVEDLQNVAIETFKKRQGIIEAKSIIRALLKGGMAAGISAAGDENQNASLSLIGIALQIFAEASERADLRGTRYFPAKAFAGGISLTPGVYSFTVRYYGAAGQLLSAFPYHDIKLNAGELNLFETGYFR